MSETVKGSTHDPSPSISAGEQECAAGASRPRPASGKSPVSKRKAAANGRNAKMSTGPRSATGKARSAQNARRHGSTAETLVIPGECAEELEQFRREILEDLAPDGPVQYDLANRYVGLRWRLRRPARAEAANARREITRRLSLNRGRPRPTEVLRILIDLVCYQEQVGLVQLHQVRIKEKIGIVFDWIEAMEAREAEAAASARDQSDSVPAAGDDSNEAPPEVREAFATVQDFLRALATLLEGNSMASTAEKDDVKKLADTIAALAPKILGTKVQATSEPEGPERIEVEEEFLRGEMASWLSRERDMLDSFTRYETTLERAAQRTLETLERLQETRRKRRRNRT